MVSQNFCSITSFEDTRFWASSKNKAIIDDSSEEDDTKHKNGDNFEEKSDKTFSDQDF